MSQQPISKSVSTLEASSSTSTLENFKFGLQNESTNVRPKSASRPKTPNFLDPLELSPQSTRDFIKTRKNSSAYADEQGNFLTKTMKDEFEKIKVQVSKSLLVDSFVDYVRDGKIDLVKECLDQSGLDPNAKNKNGVSISSMSK